MDVVVVVVEAYRMIEVEDMKSVLVRWMSVDSLNDPWPNRSSFFLVAVVASIVVVVNRVVVVVETSQRDEPKLVEVSVLYSSL